MHFFSPKITVQYKILSLFSFWVDFFTVFLTLWKKKRGKRRSPTFLDVFFSYRSLPGARSFFFLTWKTVVQFEKAWEKKVQSSPPIVSFLSTSHFTPKNGGENVARKWCAGLHDAGAKNDKQKTAREKRSAPKLDLENGAPKTARQKQIAKNGAP